MSLTRSLTRPLTRKISRADLTQGFGGSFSPFALNPYLLFDARDSMVGTLENPTLDLNPALPETLDVITATRAGVATYTDADGNIVSAPANTVRVDYTQGAELTPNIYQLVGNTDFTQSHWTKTASTVESGHISPDGTANAYKLIEDTSDSVHRIFETSTVSASPNATISVFVKYSGRRYVLIRFADQSVGRWYDLISGTLGITYLATPNDSTIEAIGNDWYRITLTHTSNAQARCEFWVSDTQSISSYTGDGESGVYIYGPQLEEGTTASSFVANTTGSPKFITGATYGPRVPMILVEPSAINRTKTSEDFNSSEWTHLGNGQGSAPIVTDNYAYSPDGTQNATRLQVSLNGGNTVTDQSLIYDIDNSNTVQTISVWMKSNTNDAYDIYLANTHIGNGTDIAQVTPQWQRFSFSHTTSNHTFSLGLRGGIGASDSADILIWGAQGETGSVATSYIPTSGSTVTRAADDLVISGSAFTDAYNQSEGTIYTEFIPRRVDYYQHLYEFSDGGSTNRINVHLENGNARFYLTSGGSVYANTIAATNVTTGELHRTGFSYKTNDAPASFDGSTEITDTTVTVPSGIDRVFLGALYTQANDFYLNGHIKRLIYWPYHSDSL